MARQKRVKTRKIALKRRCFNIKSAVFSRVPSWLGFEGAFI